MNTQTQPTEISIELMKALALCQYEGQPYFIVNGKAYEGNEKTTHSEWVECTENLPDAQNWEDYLADNCTEIEAADEYGEIDNYLILTDEEADEKCADYIKDSVWAFNASFLAAQTGLDQDVFEAIQDNGKCESNNDTITRLIEKCGDMDTFISDAINADGRVHFMNTYDGEENEETVYINTESRETLSKNDSAAMTFYIYRIN